MATRWCTGVDLSAGIGGKLAFAVAKATNGALAIIVINCILNGCCDEKVKKVGLTPLGTRSWKVEEQAVG